MISQSIPQVFSSALQIVSVFCAMVVYKYSINNFRYVCIFYDAVTKKMVK